MSKKSDKQTEQIDPNLKKVIGPYIIVNKIGHGQYGTVYLSKNRQTKQMVAIKQIQRKKLTDRLMENLARQIDVLRMINHYSVINLLDVQATKHRFYLIFELCNCGDLEKYRARRKGGRLSEEEARYLLRQVADGLFELHKQNVIHRDIKLANILLHDPTIKSKWKQFKMPDEGPSHLGQHVENLKQSKIRVKIADLGFARGLENSLAQTLCGTPINMAPEVINGQGYDGQADIWSLGTILFEMITGYSPFTGTSKEDLKVNMNKGNFAIPKRLKLSLNCVHFLNSCMQSDPNKRITFEEIMQHSFLRMEDDRQNDGSVLEEKNLQVNQMLNLSMTDVADMKTYEEMSKGNTLLESFEMKIKSPYKFLNQENAIILNTQEMERINEIYKKKYLKAQKQVENYFKKEQGLQVGDDDDDDINKGENNEMSKEQDNKDEVDSLSGDDSEYGRDQQQEQGEDNDKDEKQQAPLQDKEADSAVIVQEQEKNGQVEQENQLKNNINDQAINEEQKEQNRSSQSSYEKIDAQQLEEQQEQTTKNQESKQQPKQQVQELPKNKFEKFEVQYYQEEKKEMKTSSAKNIIYTSCIDDLHRFDREGDDHYQGFTKYNVDRIQVLDTYF